MSIPERHLYDETVDDPKSPQTRANAIIGSLPLVLREMMVELKSQIEKHIQEAIIEEREACAKIADEKAKHWVNDFHREHDERWLERGDGAKRVAAAVRAKGEE